MIIVSTYGRDKERTALFDFEEDIFFFNRLKALKKNMVLSGNKYPDEGLFYFSSLIVFSFI